MNELATATATDWVVHNSMTSRISPGRGFRVLEARAIRGFGVNDHINASAEPTAASAAEGVSEAVGVPTNAAPIPIGTHWGRRLFRAVLLVRTTRSVVSPSRIAAGGDRVRARGNAIAVGLRLYLSVFRLSYVTSAKHFLEV